MGSPSDNRNAGGGQTSASQETRHGARGQWIEGRLVDHRQRRPRLIPGDEPQRVARERDTAERRAVIVRALRERNAEVYRLYAPMNVSMDEICAGYDERELRLLTDLRRSTEARRDAASRLTSDPTP